MGVTLIILSFKHSEIQNYQRYIMCSKYSCKNKINKNSTETKKITNNLGYIEAWKKMIKYYKK